MRARADRARIDEFLVELARSAHGERRAYLIGGASAVLEGWRATTVDIDIRLEPEDDAMLKRISELKEVLDVNVEFASPPDFIPELPGWRERSPFVARTGTLDVRHFDFYSQALAKVERGFVQDLEDVREMINRRLVEPTRAVELFNAIADALYRYPAIDPENFRAKVAEAFTVSDST